MFKSYNSQKFIPMIIIQSILLVISVIFMLSVISLNILPFKYLLPVICGVVLFFALSLALQFSSSWPKYVGRVIAIITAIALLVGTLLATTVNSTLRNMGGDSVEEILLVVNENSDATTIEDLSNITLSMQYNIGGDVLRAAETKMVLEDGVEAEVSECSTILEQIKALFAGEVDAVMYNKSYEGALKNHVEGYDENIKIIKTYYITEDDIGISIDGTSVDRTKNKLLDADEPFIVYISGIDTYGELSDSNKSEVNIIAAVNPNTNKLLLVSTPADYFVEIPGITGNAKEKLSNAGLYGVEASMNALEKLYDINFDCYLKINFATVEDAVDAVGGISVNSDRAFSAGSYNFVEGVNNLNGAETLSFCRDKYDFDDTTNKRDRNQKAAIEAFVDKACSPAILSGANKIIDSLKANVKMNIPEELIQELIKKQLDDGKAWDVDMVEVSGFSAVSKDSFSAIGYDINVIEPNMESVESMRNEINKVMNG